MKRILMICAFIYTMICSTCFAHWLPESELYVGGVGAGCTMEYVQSVYGQPKEKMWFNSDGVRGVSYIYSDTFCVFARVGADDPTPEGDLPVCGFDLKEGSMATPSGITVGIPYITVAGMFGRVDEEKEYDGRSRYDYPIGMRTMSFYVDKYGVIEEIYLGTDF